MLCVFIFAIYTYLSVITRCFTKMVVVRRYMGDFIAMVIWVYVTESNWTGPLA